jgi:hypothetical protein
MATRKTKQHWRCAGWRRTDLDLATAPATPKFSQSGGPGSHMNRRDMQCTSAEPQLQRNRSALMTRKGRRGRQAPRTVQGCHQADQQNDHCRHGAFTTTSWAATRSYTFLRSKGGAVGPCRQPSNHGPSEGEGERIVVWV